MFDIITFVGYLSFALIISKRDISLRIISNRNLARFAIFSIICNTKFVSLINFLNLGLITILLILLHIVFKGRIGPGDLKLFWVMTVWTPVFLDWLAFFAWAWILGGIFTIASSLYSRRVSASIPFAPFIFLAFLASI